MRGRPTAVYRVIDEEELLGGDGVEIGGTDPLDTLAVPAVAAPRRLRAWRPAGLAPGVGVATLAAVAVALIAGLPGPHRAAAAVAPSAVPPPLRHIAAPPAAATHSRHRSSRRVPRPRRVGPARRIVPARRRIVTRRIVQEAAPQRSPAPLVRAARARQRPSSPATEFGFER